MTAADDMLANLNIMVAKPTVIKAKPSKKKKNNKYERRRQRAQTANNTNTNTNTNTNEGKHTRKPSDEVSPKQEEDAEATEQQEPEITEETTEPAAPAKEQMKPDGYEDEDEDVEEAIGDDREKSDEEPSPLEKENETSESPTKGEEASNESPSIPESIPEKDSRRRHQAPQTEDEKLKEEERAKYLAEFHARPMELDRRSGAKSSFMASLDSQHLFNIASDWKSLQLHPRLINTLTTQFGMPQPTLIQTKAISVFQDHRNILLHSETGSGKTMAYALPILQALATKHEGKDGKDRKQLGTRCLILCPTRELASQTLDTLEKLCRHSFGWLVPGCLSGGDTRKSEKARIRKGLGIVVATPGRLLDHLNKTESLLMSLKGKLEWLVLDEADRLLDMGLGDQVKQIVQQIRANDASGDSWWRSVLVSATVTASVQALAKERMLCGNKPWVWVKGGSPEEKGALSSTKPGTKDAGAETDEYNNPSYTDSTPRQLAQQHLTVSAKMRLSTLLAFLVQRVQKEERTVVFMGTCASVDYHHKLLAAMEPIFDSDDDNDRASGIFGSKGSIFKLHGSVPHSERHQVLKKFAASKNAVLLATDVAARGLNLHGVDWAVQYDPPCEVSDYVHRVGRVARAGKAGHSLLMLLPSERSFLDVLETRGISNMAAVSLSTTLNQAATSCKEVANAGKKHVGAKENSELKGSRLGEAFSAELQRRLEDCVAQEDDRAKAKWKETPKRQRSAIMKEEGELMGLARDAFISFIRAYPTKEKCVRHIFSARALHLGHVARSFALKEPPKALAHKHRQKGEKGGPPTEFEEKPSKFTFKRDEEEGDEPAAKKQRKKKSTAPVGESAKESARLKRAKSLLLENAAKIAQNNGLDAM
jgi:ATP-dependent RNA helicase DDX31/DBP7